MVLFHAMDGKELGRFLHRLIQLKAQGIYVGCREQVYTNSESFRCSRTLKQSVYCDLQEPLKEEACQVFFRILRMYVVAFLVAPLQLGLLSGWHICGDGSGRIQSKGSFGDSLQVWDKSGQDSGIWR